jgi:hypothetical protein
MKNSREDLFIEASRFRDNKERVTFWSDMTITTVLTTLAVVFIFVL